MRQIPQYILQKVYKVRDFLKKSLQGFVSIAKPLDGELVITKVYNDGRAEQIYKEKNVIVLPAKQYMLSSIYKSNFSLNLINRLQIGTGGTIDPEGLYPKSTSQLLTSLFTPLLAVTTYYTEDLTIPRVTFIADIDQSTANGSLVTEAGLLFTNGNLFNIKTFPGIPKTEDFSIHFEWTIRVA